MRENDRNSISNYSSLQVPPVPVRRADGPAVRPAAGRHLRRDGAEGRGGEEGAADGGRAHLAGGLRRQPGHQEEVGRATPGVRLLRRDQLQRRVQGEENIKKISLQQTKVEKKSRGIFLD